jgi:integrase
LRRVGGPGWKKTARCTVPNVKPGKTTGETYRTIPLFPKVRVELEAVFDRAAEGAEYVITRYRDGNANLRTQLGRISRRAGVAIWEKPFVNMRASCATELAQTYPAYVVPSWLGHSQAVAEAHYRQVTEDHFRKAAQNPAQQPPEKAERSRRRTGASTGKKRSRNGLPLLASWCRFVQYTQKDSNLQPSVP